MTRPHRRRAKLIGLAVTAVPALLVFGPAIDVFARGPLVTWHNERCMSLAEEHGLLGASAAQVEAVLGEPTSTFTSRASGDVAGAEPSGFPVADATTHDYALFPWLPYATFQVHMRSGRVVGLEMYDD